MINHSGVSGRERPEQVAPAMNRTPIRFWLIVATAALVLAQYQFAVVVARNPAGVLTAHQSIIDHTADSPYRYRLLVPYAIEAIARLIPADRETAVGVAHYPYFVAATSLTLLALFAYLRRWFSTVWALLGVLVAVVSMLVAFGDGYYQPWSILEVGFFVIGLQLILTNRRGLLLFVIVIATLNRETGVFIALADILIGVGHRWLSRWSLAGLIAWAVLFISLRLALGFAPHPTTPDANTAWNLSAGLWPAVWNTALFLGGFWWCVVDGYRASPDFIRRSWRVVPLYLLAVILFGIWGEVRLLSPLYPIFVTTGLFGLCGHDQPQPSHA